MTKFNVIVGDITDQQADAIVNAANSELLRGGGVCGAIFKAAGEGLTEELAERYPVGCETGDAVESAGYGLQARHIIHAVGPRCVRGDDYERTLLAGAYYNTIRVAVEFGCKSLMVPSLGTGIYGWDLEVATPIARAAVLSALMEFPDLEQLTFCCFREEDAEVFRRVFANELESGN